MFKFIYSSLTAENLRCLPPENHARGGEVRVTKLAVVCTVAVGALLCYGAIFGVNIFSLRSPGGTCPFFGGGGGCPMFPTEISAMFSHICFFQIFVLKKQIENS